MQIGSPTLAWARSGEPTAHTSTTSTLRSQHRFSWMSAREGMLGGVKEKGSLAGAAVVVPDDYEARTGIRVSRVHGLCVNGPIFDLFSIFFSV